MVHCKVKARQIKTKRLDIPGGACPSTIIAIGKEEMAKWGIFKLWRGTKDSPFLVGRRGKKDR